MSSKLVQIRKEYVKEKSLPSDIGLVLRGPYGHIIKLTKQFESCELMYDLLIEGSIYKMIPSVYCKRVRK